MREYDLKPLSTQRHLVWDLLRDTDPYYLNHQIILVDFTAIDENRTKFVEAGLPKPSYVAYVIYALTRVLLNYPVFNAYLREWPFTRLAYYKNIDVAYAVEKEDSNSESVLTLGMLRNSENLSFDEFLTLFNEQKNSKLEEMGYARTLSLLAMIPTFLRTTLFRLFCKPFPKIMRSIAGTVAFTSVGKYGVDFTTPLSPKSLTVSLGSVKKRPLVVEDQVEARQTAHITFTYDHRVADGSECASLANELRSFLEEDVAVIMPRKVHIPKEDDIPKKENVK